MTLQSIIHESDVDPEETEEWIQALESVLETERRLRLAEQAIITATADVWNARIDLFLALGGDWGTGSTSPTGDETEPEEASTRTDTTHTQSR